MAIKKKEPTRSYKAWSIKSDIKILKSDSTLKMGILIMKSYSDLLKKPPITLKCHLEHKGWLDQKIPKSPFYPQKPPTHHYLGLGSKIWPFLTLYQKSLKPSSLHRCHGFLHLRSKLLLSFFQSPHTPSFQSPARH